MSRGSALQTSGSSTPQTSRSGSRRVLKPVTKVYNLNLLSATGTGILLAAVLSGLLIGYGPIGLLKMYGRTLHLVRYSLLTISCMLALGFRHPLLGDRRYVGLAFAQTGWIYPLLVRSSGGRALH
jgi:L-lactate permease